MKINVIVGIVVLLSPCLLHGQTFNNIAGTQNVNVKYDDTTFGQFGSGVSFYDFNNDGWDDLTFPKITDSFMFFKNDSGNFKQTNSFIKNYGNYTRQLHWVDFNNDGDMDLFVCSRNAKNKLYENTGNLNFKDISSNAGLVTDNKTFGVSFADYNKDGLLDIYVANYEPVFNSGVDSSAFNRLYKNNGNGSFTDVTYNMGVGNGNKASFQGIWLDYNHDGWPDLYVINSLTNPTSCNTLYRNDNGKGFTNVSGNFQVKLCRDEPMTASAGDFNNDGYLDIYMTNSHVADGRLLVNSTYGAFVEKAVQYGVDIDKFSWGSVWVDYDNDTYQDLFVTTDNGNPVNYENYFYENLEGDTFTRSSKIFNNNSKSKSHSVAKGDLNNDGYYDLVVQNNTPKEALLWQNSGGTNRYIKVTLQGTESNRMAIGSWIKVYVDSHEYVRYTKCGQNYMSQDSQHKIIGLDSGVRYVDSLTVEYLSGHKDKYYNLAADTHYYFKEGDSNGFKLGEENKLICKGDTILLEPQLSGNFQYDSVKWNNGDTSFSMEVTKPGSYWMVAENKYDVNIYSDTVEVQEYPGITTSVNHVSCHDSTNGSIKLDFGKYAKLYNHNLKWESGKKGTYINTLSAGKYVFNYADTNNCRYKDTITVKEPGPLNVHTRVIYDTAKKDSVAGIKLNIKGGTAPYKTYLNGMHRQAPFTNLPRDTYDIAVIDTNGCKFTTQVKVTYKKVPRILSRVKPVNCPDDQNGAIRLKVDTPANTSFNIKWENGMSGTRLNGLKQGVYTFHYRDNHGTHFMDSNRVPAKSAIKIKKDVQHQATNRLGSINLRIKGGKKPYRIQSNGKITGRSIDSLKAGIYDILVKDALGCSKQLTVKIDNLDVPEVSANVKDVGCYGGSDGSVVVKVDTVSNIPFEVNWEDGASGLKRKGLESGKYIFKYVDSLGNVYKDSVRIDQPAPITHNKQIVSSSTTSCNVTITVDGGVKPYAIKLDNNKVGNPVADLEQGTYTLSIKDGNNCSYDTAVTVKGNYIPDIEADVKHLSCHDTKDGRVRLQFDKAPSVDYKVEWSNGKNGTELGGLPAEMYRYHYTVTKECGYEDSVEVKAPSELDIRKKVVDAGEGGYGSLHVIVNGGVPPYKVYLDDTLHSEVIDSLKPGVYELRVVDANGCHVKQNVTIDGGTFNKNIYQTANGKLNVKPNPVKRGKNITFRISAEVNRVQLKVYDNLGKLVYHKNVQNNAIVVDTDFLNTGMYYVTLNSGKGNYSGKFIVKE